MTVTTASLHITDNGAAAAPVRRFYEALYEGRQGPAGLDDLEVTEKSGTPDMSVDVAAGSCLITGTESASQGAYWLENLATLNVTITAADATNPRKDLIVAKVQDSDFSGATDAGSIVVVDGTPAGSPAEPAVPDNAVVLAMVDVAALASSIVDANITDRRTSTSGQDRIAASGGIIRALSTAQLPASPAEGQFAWQADQGQLMVYTSTAWEILVKANWLTYVPADIAQGGARTSTKTGRYNRVGNTIHGVVRYALTDTGTSAGVTVGLPATTSASMPASVPIGVFYFSDDSTGGSIAGIMTGTPSTTVGTLFDTTGGTFILTALGSSDLVTAQFTYEAV